MPKFPINIFLPAAGLGERLRPVTNHMPKPLLPIIGRPLIGIILGKLTSVCDGKIGVNVHYKSDMILEWFKNSHYERKITVFPENPILGTGGALKNAEPFLSSGPFIVHNADILLDIPFSKLIEAHLSSGAIATLATHRHPDLSNVVLDEKDHVIDVENPGESRPNKARIGRKTAYTGVAVYSPEILKFLPAGVSHATTAWLAAAKAGRIVKAMDFTGSYWSDVGTPATYAAAVFDALQMIGETTYRSPKASVGKAEIDGYIVVEGGATVQDGTRLRNCVVMPGADVSGIHENCIIGPGYHLQLAEQEMMPSSHAALRKDVGLSGRLFAFFDEVASPKSGSIAPAVLIGFGGSDRRYFRVRKSDKTAVLMESTKDDPDFERHLQYTEFFRSQRVPVPQLYGADEQSRRALFEDLGDLTLYGALKFADSAGRIEKLYRQVMDVLVLLHAKATENVGRCPLLASRIFDYEHLRWETTYFLERYVAGFRNISPENRREMDEEFRQLANTAGSFLPVVIHRDFQCQNIMIHKGSVRVIDYQGARMAPPAYDVVSILWDPYHRLDDGMRERLLAYYVEQMKANAADFDEASFSQSILPFRLQRHMQALGAYGFLSVEKKKKYFIKHMPEALRLLKEEILLVQNEYPALARLVGQL